MSIWSRFENWGHFVSGILMIIPGTLTDIPGFILFLIVVFLQTRRRKQQGQI